MRDPQQRAREQRFTAAPWPQS